MRTSKQCPQFLGAWVGAYIHQTETRRRLLSIRPIPRAHGPRGTSWVHKESALHLKRLEAMCSSPQQDIHVHLASGDEQGVCIPRRDDGVAMGEANAKTTVGNDLGEREVGRIDVEITLDQLQIGGDLAEELEGVAIRQVAQTEDLADLAGGEEFAELGCQYSHLERCKDRICAPWPADPRRVSDLFFHSITRSEQDTHGSSVRDEKVTDDQDETRGHRGEQRTSGPSSQNGFKKKAMSIENTRRILGIARAGEAAVFAGESRE